MTIIWALFGYSLAFSNGVGALAPFIGGLSYLGLNGVSNQLAPLAPTIPHTVYAMYQGMFAIITVGLITGAVAERMKFKAYVDVHGAVGDLRLQPARPLGLAAGRLAVQARRARLRRRYGRPHLVGGRCAGRRAACSASARGYGNRRDPPPQPAADRARRRHPVVRLVRLQRRLRAGGQPARGLGVPQHARRCRGRAASPGCSPSRSTPASPRCSARRPARSRVSSRITPGRRLRRALGRARSSAPSPARCATSALRTQDQVRLRRRARRRRHPRRGRDHRRDPHRRLRHRGHQLRRAQRAAVRQRRSRY